MKILRPELVVDVGWLALCIGYVAQATHYPEGGRLVPMVVGLAGAALGAVHMAGNFVSVLRPFTHGNNGDDAVDAESPDGMPEPEQTEAGDGHPEPGAATRYGGIFWALFLVLGIYIIGAVWVMPVFFIPYFGIRGGRWGLGLVAGLGMMLVTWGLFGQLIQLQLPQGIIWSLFG